MKPCCKQSGSKQDQPDKRLMQTYVQKTLKKESLVPKGADACGGPERGINLQIERPKR